MTIFGGSRYRNVEKTRVVFEDGETAAMYVPRTTTVVPPEGLEGHLVKAGETFESMAFELFGDANKWYVLADFNPHIFFPLDLKVGDRIVRPTKAYAAQV